MCLVFGMKLRRAYGHTLIAQGAMLYEYPRGTFCSLSTVSNLGTISTSWYVTAEIFANEENREPHDPENQEDDGELEPEDEHEEGETPENSEQRLPLHSRFPMERLLHRAHVGLGHPTSDRFVRILRYAKAKPEVIEAAKHLRRSVCQRHSQVKPARRSAPPKELKELAFNECVGVDVIFLPTLGSRSRPALNVIDWSSKFQLMIPMDNKKPGHVREAYRHWLRLFGPPKRMVQRDIC